MRFFKEIYSRVFSSGKGEGEPDKFLIMLAGGLVVFGLVMLSSATSAFSYAKFGDSYYLLKHQLLGLFLGLGAFYFCSRFDYRIWKKYALISLIISIGLLLLVFIPGLSAEYGSARSWINIFGFSIQPSEFVKISLLLYFAAWLEGKNKSVEKAKPFFGILLFVAFLMLLQPDAGTLAIITMACLAVYYVGGGRAGHIMFLGLVGVVALLVLIKIMPYQADRFKCFFDPDYSPQDVCYQINQSLVAVGSGGFFGRGLGYSRQKFMYLPEVGGDSVFAVIGEEIGFVFSFLLICAYLALFYRGVKISAAAPDYFGRALAVGIVTWLVGQAMINIGGAVNLLPITGVPLPLVSYGGSAMIAALAGIGILVNISKHGKT